MLADQGQTNTFPNQTVYGIGRYHRRGHGKILELYTTVLPAVFLVLVFCWYQICWIFGISVGIVPPFFVYFPPFLPPFFPKGG
jgi:hypothetical protein